MIRHRSSMLPVILIALFCSGSNAVATDYGISFHYSRYTPQYTSVRYASPCYSKSYVYCDDFDDYTEPVVYSASIAPKVIVRRDRYPVSYTTTYTRSDCYTRPVTRVHSSVCYDDNLRAGYRDGYAVSTHRGYGYSSRPAYRSYSYRTTSDRYSARPATCGPSVRVSVNRSGSSYHNSHHGSYHRSSYRPTGSYRAVARNYYGHNRGGPRIRVIRH